jgi:HTH-type transcriptional regulator/antitoxin HigA
VVIESNAEHGRALKAAAALMDKEKKSPAETSLLKRLSVLIEDYEQKRYTMGDASPLESLKELMRARDMQAKDLWPVFCSKGITSEVLNGKRGISNEMARKLGELFSVSPAVFIRIHPMQPEIDASKAQKKEVLDGVSLRLAPGTKGSSRRVPQLSRRCPATAPVH